MRKSISQSRQGQDRQRERLREISGMWSRDSRLSFSQLQTGELTTKRGRIIYGKGTDMYGVIAKRNQQVIEHVTEKIILP